MVAPKLSTHIPAPGICALDPTGQRGLWECNLVGDLTRRSPRVRQAGPKSNDSALVRDRRGDTEKRGRPREGRGRGHHEPRESLEPRDVGQARGRGVRPS